MSFLNLSVSYLHCGLYDATTHDICEGTSLPSLYSYHIHDFPGLKEENTQVGWIFGPMEKLILKLKVSLLRQTCTVLSVVRVTLNPVCTRFPE